MKRGNSRSLAEFAREFTRNKTISSRSLFVVTVTFVQVLLMCVSRDVCCAKTPGKRKVLTHSTYVTIVGHLKKGSRLLKVSCKLDQVELHMPLDTSRRDVNAWEVLMGTYVDALTGSKEQRTKAPAE